MTKEEMNAIVKIICTADGGCPSCVRELAYKLHKEMKFDLGYLETKVAKHYGKSLNLKKAFLHFEWQETPFEDE